MRMKKLLMFLVLLTVSVGSWAVEWTNLPSSVTITEEDDGKTLVINSTDGSAFQTFWANNIANANGGGYKKIKYVGSFAIQGSGFSYLQGSSDISSTELTIPVIDVSGVTDMYGDKTLTNQNVTTVIYNGSSNITSITDNGGNDVILVNKGLKTATAKLSGSDELASAMPQIDVALDRLTITGTLSSDDAAVLNATAVDASGVTTVTAELEEIKGTATYMALPAGYSTADLESLKTNNPNLQVAMGFEDLNTNKPKLTMHSFSSNNVVNAANALNNFANIRACKYVSMKGNYGDHDLVDGTSLNFGDVAVWDFTGATFVACNVDGTVADRGPYYASNDPFCEHGTVTPLSSTYPSNAFYYFRNYSTKVVDIKLPTGITELPPNCMNRLGEENGDNYKLVNNLTSDSPEIIALEAELSATMAAMNKTYTSGQYYPIEQLVIPDNIETIGYECCVQSVIKSIMLGQNVTDVQGGAFKLNYFLEDVSCKPGISNCRLGDQAFNECNNMKHIQLSEGIISLGANCFNNSQHLESIRLPQTLLYIGNYCFKDGHALSSITIPENVEKIGMQAFALTALKDVYLTTTDPAKVPVIYTAGYNFNDMDCTFSANEMYGNNSCPYGLADTPEPGNQGFGSMTWDEAVDWYYSHSNLIGVLHYPTELAEKVRADLAQQYAFRCEVDNNGGFGLPNQAQATTVRGSIEGTYGSDNKGLYTSDGWAQFSLMKEYIPNKDIVYTKEYDDVWYTMCFPFDLTDEQLAGAFNETFNIVDFSAVEIRPATETEKKTLVLHFNNVAETTYKDADDNIYVRKRTDGLTGDVIREQDGAFFYNVYYKVENGTPNTSVEYHHYSQSSSTSIYKTKTFKAANSDEVLLIDGYLASAGHPYMIHPSTGTQAGSPKVRCYFSGISWKPEEDGGGYDNLYTTQARTVDLGGTAYSGSAPETITYVTEGNNFTENNFDQAPYAGYEGQTYTFKGNWRECKDGAPAKPTVENGQLEAYPSVQEYLGDLYKYYPDGPYLEERGGDPRTSTYWQDLLGAVGARMTAADEPTEPTQGSAPDYADNFYTFYNSTYEIEGTNYLVGEGILGWSFTDVASGPHNWGVEVYQLNNNGGSAFKAYFDPNNNSNNSGAILTSDFNETKFNTLKSMCQTYYRYLHFDEEHANWLAEHQAWQNNMTTYSNYDAAIDYYDNYDAVAAQAYYEAAQTNYPARLTQWQNECRAVDTRNEATLAAWKTSMASYNILIPKNAYFLGRKKNSAGQYIELPKYYRETADDSTPRTTGIWTQYSAIIMPNDAALAGIEKGVDPNVQGGVKGYNIAFNEEYEGEFDPTEIKDIIAKAEEKGQKVEYMNIVYSINGEIISRDTQSLSNLPKGMYIINGKKYLVK